MTQALAVIGVPCSASAHHGGLERGPAALRAAGLPDRLRQAGWEVPDAPQTTIAGNFDGMMIAALLGEGDPGYIGLAGPVPTLPPQRLAILGYDDSDIDPRERHLLGPPSSHADGKHVAADPAGAAAAARAHVEASAGAIVVHFDVDAVDSADLPLANYPHHGKGLTFEAATTVLRELCASPALTAMVLTEVNPTQDPAGELLGRYLDGVTAAVAEPARDQ